MTTVLTEVTANLTKVTANLTKVTASNVRHLKVLFLYINDNAWVNQTNQSRR